MADHDINKILADLASNSETCQQRAYEIIKQSKDVRFVDGLIECLLDDDETLQKNCISLRSVF